jgi:hypothetical protein
MLAASGATGDVLPLIRHVAPFHRGTAASTVAATAEVKKQWALVTVSSYTDQVA